LPPLQGATGRQTIQTMADRDPKDEAFGSRAKLAILARRANFVAAAIASVGLAGCEKKEEGPPPVSCLSVMMEPDAAATQADTAPATTSATPPATATGPQPAVCLSPMPPPTEPTTAPTAPPKVCLDVMPEPADAGPKGTTGPTPKPLPKPKPMPCLSELPPGS
jgi:hypothetical protein